MLRSIARLAFPLAALMAGSCATVGDAWMLGWTERAANDQIMLVGNTPPTLGYQRLNYHKRIYADLASFIGNYGTPDFVAEATNDGRRYLVLYYLRLRQAFLCSTNLPDNRTMEITGPYPVTKHEYELLSGLQKNYREGTAPGSAT